jgi:hypothetical protein
MGVTMEATLVLETLNRALGQGRLKVRHKAAGAGMLVPFSSGLLASLGPAFCQY